MVKEITTDVTIYWWDYVWIFYLLFSGVWTAIDFVHIFYDKIRKRKKSDILDK